MGKIDRRKMAIGTYTYIVGAFGFIFLMVIFILIYEMFDMFDMWVVAAASGYDANTYIFMSTIIWFLPVIFLFSFGIWVYNEMQKRGGEYQ